MSVPTHCDFNLMIDRTNCGYCGSYYAIQGKRYIDGFCSAVLNGKDMDEAICVKIYVVVIYNFLKVQENLGL